TEIYTLSLHDALLILCQASVPCSVQFYNHICFSCSMFPFFTRLQLNKRFKDITWCLNWFGLMVLTLQIIPGRIRRIVRYSVNSITDGRHNKYTNLSNYQMLLLIIITSSDICRGIYYQKLCRYQNGTA